MSEERRITDIGKCWDAALVMGIVYTLIYGLTVAGSFLVSIPAPNLDTVKQLVSNMTIIQVGVAAYFFGASKSAEKSASVLAESKERTDSVLREVVSVQAGASAPGTANVTESK